MTKREIEYVNIGINHPEKLEEFRKTSEIGQLHDKVFNEIMEGEDLNKHEFIDYMKSRKNKQFYKVYKMM